MRGRTRVGAGGKLASTQIITCVHTCAVAVRRRSGSKKRSARNGSNTQFTAPASKPRAPNHHCPQEMADPLRVCVNIPAVAEREYQNPPASAPQPLRACVNVALGGISQLCRASPLCEGMVKVAYHSCLAPLCEVAAAVYHLVMIYGNGIVMYRWIFILKICFLILLILIIVFFPLWKVTDICGMEASDTLS